MCILSVARTPTVQLFVRTHPGAAPTPGDGEIPEFLDHLDSIVNVYIAINGKSPFFNRYIHYIWIIYIYTCLDVLYIIYIWQFLRAILDDQRVLVLFSFKGISFFTLVQALFKRKCVKDKGMRQQSLPTVPEVSNPETYMA